MAKSKSTKQVEATPKTASKLVNCLDCVLAQLHRYGNNPVLAACEAHPQMDNERFPFEVVMASFLRYCKEHKHTDNVKEIEQRRKVA